MRHLIIAEDGPDLLDVYRSFAERTGWDVQTCTSGNGIKPLLADGQGPILLLIDINMPDMDGIEAIDEILEVPRPKRLRFMTGGDDAPIIAAKMIASARDLICWQKRLQTDFERAVHRHFGRGSRVT